MPRLADKINRDGDLLLLRYLLAVLDQDLRCRLEVRARWHLHCDGWGGVRKGCNRVRVAHSWGPGMGVQDAQCTLQYALCVCTGTASTLVGLVGAPPPQ